MEYTENMETALFELWGDEDNTPERVLGFLNDENSFRCFSDGLNVLIRKYMPESSDLSEKDFLKKQAQAKGISINRNTLNNWFSGTRPKKGQQSREHMYLISFALGMDVEDTKDLFKKVYLDRPFNMRNKNEFVYYYCIKNHYGYERVCSMLERLDSMEFEEEEGTIYTNMLQTEANELLEDDEVLDYIVTHPHNFQINNRTAMQKLEKLLEQIRVSDKDKLDFKNGKILLSNENQSYVIREINHCSYKLTEHDENNMVGKYKSLSSIPTMLNIIKYGFTRIENHGGQSIFKNSSLPKEIISRMPTEHSFSKTAEQLSFEEIRKMIILLFSYKFWFKKQYQRMESGNLDDYAEQLDALLYECSLQKLYYGNPFDWLFLYCSMNDEPLDMFRMIIAEGRETD